MLNNIFILYKRKSLRYLYNSVYLLTISLCLYILINIGSYLMPQQYFNSLQAKDLLCTCSDHPAEPSCADCEDNK